MLFIMLLIEVVVGMSTPATSIREMHTPARETIRAGIIYASRS